MENANNDRHYQDEVRVTLSGLDTHMVVNSVHITLVITLALLAATFWGIK